MTDDLKALVHERRELVHAVQSNLEKVMQMQERIVEIDRELEKPIDVLAGMYGPLIKAAQSLASKDLETAGRKDIEPIVTEILMAHDRPMPSKQLFNLLSARLSELGMCIGGKRPEANMGAHLSHVNTIENVHGEGWICTANPKTPLVRRTPGLVPPAHIVAPKISAPSIGEGLSRAIALSKMPPNLSEVCEKENTG